MAVGRLLINDYDRSAYVDFRSVSIEASTAVKGASLSFSMTIPSVWSGTYDRRGRREYTFTIDGPEGGNTVILETFNDDDWDFDTHEPNPGAEPLMREFGGEIITAKKKLLAPPADFTYECECQDWTLWLDRRLVHAVIPSLPEEIEVGMVSFRYLLLELIRIYCRDRVAYLYYGAPSLEVSAIDKVQGYYVNDLDRPDPSFSYYFLRAAWNKAGSVEMAPQKFEYLRLSEIFNDLCEQAGFQWYIDSYRRIHFYDKDIGVGDTPIGAVMVEQEVFETDTSRIEAYSDLEITDNIAGVKNSYYFGGLLAPGFEITVIVTRDGEGLNWWNVLALIFLTLPTTILWSIIDIQKLQRGEIVNLRERFFVVRPKNVEELVEQIQVWVCDLEEYTNEDSEKYEDIVACRKEEITNFEIVNSVPDALVLRSQKNKTLFYCRDSEILIASTDLIDWDTEFLAISGKGFDDTNTSIVVDVEDAIVEMSDREHSCGVYEDYIEASDFPLSWSTSGIFDSLAERAAYPRTTGSLRSLVAGWAPGQKFKFMGYQRWRLYREFYVTSVTKSFRSDRIMETEVAFSTNLYKGA